MNISFSLRYFALLIVTGAGSLFSSASAQKTAAPSTPATAVPTPVRIEFTMPYDGKVTVVVNDAKGVRVRNLLSQGERKAGKQTLAWDGRDEGGKKVPAGVYKWKVLTHKPLDLLWQITPNSSGNPPWWSSAAYDSQGGGSWLSDHGAPQAITVIGERVFIGTPAGEAGHLIIAADMNGKKLWGSKWLELAGSSYLANDGKKVYSVGEGGWVGNQILIHEIDPQTFAWKRVGQLAFDEAKSLGGGVSGIAARDGKLYLAFNGPDAKSHRLSIFNIADGKWERSFTLPSPRFPTFDQKGNLYLSTGGKVARINLESGGSTPLNLDGLQDPRGMAFDADNNLYVADGKAEIIRVYSAAGKVLRTIGTPGGRLVGVHDVNRIENPQGIALDNTGRIWITESDFQPKRTSLFGKDGKFQKEFMGPSGYGSGGFLDPQDKSRFYYFGMEFALDWNAGGWHLKNVLNRDDFIAKHGITEQPVYLNNTQYMVNSPEHVGWHSGLYMVGKFVKDRVQALTMVGIAELWLPFKEQPEFKALLGNNDPSWTSFVWTDANDDGKPQTSEVTVYPGERLESSYAASRVNPKLEVAMFSRKNTKDVERVYILKPKGFSPSGAPIYRLFEDKPIPDAMPGYSMAVAKNGLLLLNRSPLRGVRASGEVEWTYPNKAFGVLGGGSTVPAPGEMLGAFSFVGQADVPGVGETVMINGNKGQWWLFTADGMLIDTLWHDIREPNVKGWFYPVATRGMSVKEVTVAEEHFFGSYIGTNDGKYYVVAGHNHNSVVELTGLDTLKLQTGDLNVSAAAMAAANAWGEYAPVGAIEETAKIVTAKAPVKPVMLDGVLDEWTPADFQTVGQRGAFAIAYDAKKLYLAYRVDSGNAMRNSGDDAKMLFKSGDSVVLEIGTNSAADAARNTPAPGDGRVLISRLGGKPTGVFYKHRVPGTPVGERTQFSSPVGVEYVDKIVSLARDDIAVSRTKTGYGVEVAIPLELLGLQPKKGVTYKVDFGILSADESGSVTMARTFWANPMTGVVSDVPTEIRLTPYLWGDLKFD